MRVIQRLLSRLPSFRLRSIFACNFAIPPRAGSTVVRVCLTPAMQSNGMLMPDGLDASVRDGGGADARANGRVCIIVLLLFIIAAAASASWKDVTHGFDELAHASYVAHLQKSGEIWPIFNEMRMLDATSFHFTAEDTYPNHPSP